MGILPIRIAGDPVLREKAKKVKKIDDSIQKLIDDMIETMHCGARRRPRRATGRPVAARRRHRDAGRRPADA